MQANSVSTIDNARAQATHLGCVGGTTFPPAQVPQSLTMVKHQQGIADKSAALILQALRNRAGRASSYNDLGNLLVQTGDLDNAAAAFLQSVKLNDHDANVWNNFGYVLYRQKQFAAAESAYRSALRHDAEFVPALRNLAALLEEMGCEEESSLLSCRAFVLPPLEGKSLQMLGVAYYRLGRIEDAAECYRGWLEAEPDNTLARYRLDASTGENAPARTPDDVLKTIFDEMAESFEERLVGKLSYKGPEIIAGLLMQNLTANRALDVLDGGCGTGLCSPVLAPYARQLIGVDISPGMLANAKKRGLYAELADAELLTYLLAKNHAFDLIVMADTLVYFGDLSALFAAVRQALRPGGSFAFTVENTARPKLRQLDFHLKPNGRYGHSRGYLSRELDIAGFACRISDDVVLRNEFCKPVQGIGVLACAEGH